MLIALCLKDPSCLGKLCDQPGGYALGLHPSGYRGSKIGPKGADHLPCLVSLSDGLVVLSTGHAVL